MHKKERETPLLTPLNLQLLNNLITSAEEAEEEDVVSWNIIKMKMAEKSKNLSTKLINSDCHFYLNDIWNIRIGANGIRVPPRV